MVHSVSSYSKAELVVAAKAHGFPVSERLVTDWVSVGLLDRPIRRGLGQGGGRGSQARWPENQRRLFLSLLPHRARGAHIAALENMPVWIWLTWGDEYVPLRQVRRALATWGASAKGASWVKARKLARDLVQKLASPNARGTRQLIDVIARSVLTERFNEDEVRSALRPVLDPKGTGRRRGPAGAELDAETYIRVVTSRLVAVRGLDEFPDRAFVDARAVYRITRQEYAVQQPTFARAPDLGVFFEAPDLNNVANSACSDLLTILGMTYFTQAAQRKTEGRSSKRR